MYHPFWKILEHYFCTYYLFLILLNQSTNLSSYIFMPLLSFPCDSLSGFLAFLYFTLCMIFLSQSSSSSILSASETNISNIWLNLLVTKQVLETAFSEVTPHFDPQVSKSRMKVWRFCLILYLAVLLWVRLLLNSACRHVNHSRSVCLNTGDT
jgi:hypothetical protein